MTSANGSTCDPVRGLTLYGLLLKDEYWIRQQTMTSTTTTLLETGKLQAAAAAAASLRLAAEQCDTIEGHKATIHNAGDELFAIT